MSITQEEWAKYLEERKTQEWTQYLKEQQELLDRIIEILERNYGVCEHYKLMREIPEVLDTAIAIGIKQGFIEAKANGITLSSKHLARVTDVEDIPEEIALQIAHRTSWAFVKSFIGLDNQVHYRIQIPVDAVIVLKLRGLIGQKTLLDFL